MLGKDLINLMTTDSEWKRNMTIDVKWVIDEISEIGEIAKETEKESVTEIGVFHYFNKLKISLTVFWLKNNSLVLPKFFHF